MRDPHGHAESTTLRTLHGERVRISVQIHQSRPRVSDTYALDDAVGGLAVEPRPVITHLERQKICVAPCANLDSRSRRALRQPVVDRVLYQRLEDERGNERVANRVVDIGYDGKPVLEPDSLNRGVVIQDAQFVS